MKWRITLGLLVMSLMSIAQTFPTNSQQLLKDPQFLTVLQRHLSNLNQVQSASAMSSGTKSIESTDIYSIDQAAYRQACEILLNDPVFLDELVSYLGQLEQVMADEIYQPELAYQQPINEKKELPLNTMDTLSSMQIIYDKIAAQVIEKIKTYKQLAVSNSSIDVSEPAPKMVVNKSPLEEFQLPTPAERAALANETNSSNVEARFVNHQTTFSSFDESPKYYLQMGYFRSAENAEKLLSELQTQFSDQPVSMHLIEIRGKMRHRVRMGAFVDATNAQELSTEIRKKGFNCYVRQEGK